MKLAAVAWAAVMLAIAACGSSSTHSCVAVPQTIPNSRLITSGTKLTATLAARWRSLKTRPKPARASATVR